MNPKEYLKLAASKSPKIKEIYTEQYQMANILYESMKLDGVVQVSQGPTGMGKTLVLLAVARACVELQKRVLIAVPTYNHLIENLIQESKFIFESEPPTLYGKSNSRYTDQIKSCPRKLEECINPLSDECKQEKCKVVKEYNDCFNSPIVFTVHAVLVSKPSHMNKFDVILIDESHGFPNVIRSMAQETLTLKKLEKVLDEEKETLEFENIRKDLRIVKGMAGNRKPPPILAQRIFENLKKLSDKSQRESRIREYSHYDTARFTSDGSIFLTRRRRKFSLKENISVGLISATIEDARSHVNDCQFDSLIMRPADSYGNTERFRKRFERRPIYSLIDGPNLGKGDLKNYSIFRDKANIIIKKLVESINEVILILCQNTRDANEIKKELEKSDSINKRLTVLPDNPDSNDLDTYEQHIRSEIALGKNVIIATASSRLWEGANVPNLHLLIIDALPYRRMSEDEMQARGYKKSQSWKNMKRFMLNRIQQGVGRLVRKDDDWGVAIIIDGRFYIGKNQFFKNLPNYITSENIFRWILEKNVYKDIKSMIENLKEGKNARKYKDITDFLGEKQ
ncbi:MAG: helicase C-terminal domain-containing protein [Candidatus Heimdallarchaeota archaeon]